METKEIKITCGGCQWKGGTANCHWANIKYEGQIIIADLHCPSCGKKLESNKRD